jgi:dolichyl-phosphate-mannose-protein mannosyltransferase
MARPSGAKSPASRAAPQPTNTLAQNSRAKSKAAKNKDYTSDGVQDNDVFLLPVSDYQVMIAITVLAAVVRLFKIYQPTSVVFDEVQYVLPGRDELAY